MMIKDEELRNLYKTSGEEHLQNLEAGLLYLQQHPRDETTLEKLAREAYILQGDSRSVGIEPVETLAHQVEGILSSIKEQQIVFTPQVSNCLSQGLEAIGLLVQEAVTGVPSGVDTAVVAEQLRGAVEPSELEGVREKKSEGNNEQTRGRGDAETRRIEVPPKISFTQLEVTQEATASLIEDEELREIYQISSAEHLQNLKAGLVRLQQYPDDETTLTKLVREAHSLKGDSRILGIESVETLAHQVENLLKSLKEQKIVFTLQMSDCLFQGLEAMELLVQEAVTGEPSRVDTTGVVEQLEGAVSVLPVEAVVEQGNAPQAAPTLIEDEELREIYQTSSTERLQKLEDGLLHLQQDPDDETTLTKLVREAHSLKGDSRILGIESVETLAHKIENLLKSLKEQKIVFTLQMSDRLFQGLEAMELLVQEAVTGEPSRVDTTGVVELLEGAVSVLPVEAVVEQGNAPQAAPTLIEDEELREIYQTSSTERLQKLEDGLLHLQQDPDDETTLTKLVRDAHSLKGDSRILGIESVETLAHKIENLLKSLKEQKIVFTLQMSDRLFQGLEAMELLVQEAVTGVPSGVDTTGMLEQLEGAISVLPVEAVVEQSNTPQAAPTLIEDEELREIYQTSSTERLQKLEDGLLHLQQDPDDETTLTKLVREAHSLKADSRILGIESVQTLAHQVQEILESLKEQQTTFTLLMGNLLFQGLEVIELLVQEAVTGTPSGVDITGMLEQLREAVSEQGNASQAVSTLIEDEELREIYQISSTERLQKLEAGLLHLQHYPDDQTTLTKLVREAHSLMGDSRILGLESVETLAQQVEELLKSIKDRQTAFTRRMGNLLTQGLEAISLLAQEAVTGVPSGVDTAGMLNRLLEELATVKGLQSEVAQKQVGTPQVAGTYIEDEELRDIYKTVSAERLQKLEAGLLHLEKHPDDQTTLAELLREAHSLKGDSRSTGIEPVETLIHQVEEILGGVKRQQLVLTPQVSDLLYEGLDTMGFLVREAVTGESSGVDTVGMLNRLLEVVPEAQAPEPQLPSSIAQPTPTIQELPPVPQRVGEPYSIDTIRVATAQLDGLMTQADELTVTRIRIAQTTSEIEKMVSLWEEWKAFHRQGQYLSSSSSGTNPYEERLETMINSLRTSAQENSAKLDFIAGELGEGIRTLRLLPLSTIFQLFPRMVRDLAKQQGKEVELIIEGGETTADKHILEEIKDSLMHLLRNAIDHGIETPPERESLGKPAVATIRLRGYQTTNSIAIEIADDGRGLDAEQIKQTAIRRRLYTPEQLELMTPSQIHALIFAPGFSTRTFITEISGRGIGLDVVRTNVERLQGNIQIESTPGQGATFRLQLSTSLTTANALLLEVQGIVHALPIEFVQTSLLVSQEQIVTIEGRDTIELDGKAVPVGNLADLLQLSNSPAYASIAKVEQQQSHLRPCILLKVGEKLSGFLIDRLLDTQEVILKPQSQLLRRVRNVSGATILGTGEVCMMLNPPDLLRSLQGQATSPVSIKPRETASRKSVILLVEDSLTVRTQEKRLLERAGYEVVIAVDGLDGYNQLQTRDFDAVLSDVEMPHLDGLSLTAKIRQHPEYNELPIILITTLAADEDKRRGAEAGANAYIIKGKFNQDFLLETLERLV